jgi:DNA-binding transcriptional MerR regulator
MNPQSRSSFHNTIGDVSELFGLTPRAKRFYEERGLIWTRRDSRNRRLFDDDSRRRLQLIATLRRSHLALPDIADILDCEGGEAKQVTLAIGKLSAQRQRLEEMLQALQGAMEELSRRQHPLHPRSPAA